MAFYEYVSDTTTKTMEFEGLAPLTVEFEDGTTGQCHGKTTSPNGGWEPSMAEGGTGFSTPNDRNWPIKCDSSAVGSRRAPELRKFYKDHGIHCEVTGKGQPVYTSQSHKELCLSKRHMHDNNSFN